ncbi:MAG: restriction endonuclease subunit S [Bacteroidales bacterium]|nr:restriction endonuclease subunit S [Bacteroidales bacterium]
MEYKQLGDYIREVNVRNRDLKVTRLVGLTIDKAFIPSVANVIGTDLSNYKVICREQFACSLMQVSRDGKMPIAMFEEDEAIMSPAYPMFEVVDKTKLLPQYLMMWFSRSEFDREASYYAVGGVRGSLTWEDFCNMQLPVPSIERQREIVSEYETLTRRIRLNEQMIAHLEATAQALYRKTFVDNIDKENLPAGWRIGTFTEVIDICGGGTPSTDIIEYWEDGNIPFYSPGDKTSFYYSLVTGKHITEKGLIHCNSKLYPENTTFVTARGATTGGLTLTGCPMAMNQTCYALVAKDRQNSFYVHQLALEMMISLKNEAVGATFEALVTKDFENTEIVIAPIKARNAFNKEAEVLYENMLIIQQENTKLTELQSLLLAKMGK